MGDIIWPGKYLPGTTDNFVSNEVIVKVLASTDVWPFLINATLWPTYYNNASKIGFDEGAGPELNLGARFRFTTFGLDVEAEVTEYVPRLPESPPASHGALGSTARKNRPSTYCTPGS